MFSSGRAQAFRFLTFGEEPDGLRRSAKTAKATNYKDNLLMTQVQSNTLMNQPKLSVQHCSITSLVIFAGLFVVVLTCSSDLRAQTPTGNSTVVQNWFVVDESPVDQASCTTCTSTGRAGYGAAGGYQSCGPQCIDPFQPAQFVPPSQQPIGVRGCNCDNCIRGIDCAKSGGTEQRWRDAEPINFDPLGHGEWVGPVRLPSMLQYRVRVGDELQFVFVNIHRERSDPYRLMVGDELAIQSVTDDNLRLGDIQRGAVIQPDGTLVLPYIGALHVAGMTIEELRKKLEKDYVKYLKNPAIDVLPVKTNTKLQDLNLAVTNFASSGGQNISAIVNPDGRIQLPVIGSVRVIGMTLEEVKREVNLQYANKDYYGIEIEPRLARQAPHFVFITGEVVRPGRVELLGPTTVSQAIALAEGYRLGGNQRQVVIFRRAEDWRLIATMLDLRGAMLAKRPNPADEIWLRDGDLIIVPPQPIKLFDNWVRLVFTDGIYGIAPAVLFSNNGGGGGIIN